MSQITINVTVTLPIRRVFKKQQFDMYYVQEKRTSGLGHEWVDVSKGYAHSTSAFAALGRLTQKSTLASDL